MPSRVHSSTGKSNNPINTTLVAKKQTAQPVNTPQSELLDPKFNFNISNIPLSSPHRPSQPPPRINPKLSNTKFLNEKEQETDQEKPETAIQTFAPSIPVQPQEEDEAKKQLQQPELRAKSESHQQASDSPGKLKSKSDYGINLNKITISTPNRPPKTPPVQPKLKVSIPPSNRLQQRINERREEIGQNEELRGKAIASSATSPNAPNGDNPRETSNFAVQARTKLVGERNKNRRSLQKFPHKSPLQVTTRKSKVLNHHPTSTPWIERMSSFVSQKAKLKNTITVNQKQQKTLTAEKELKPLEAKKTNESNSAIAANKEKPANSIKEKDAKPLAAKQVGTNSKLGVSQKEPTSPANKDKSEKTPQAPSPKDTSPAQASTPNSSEAATNISAGENTQGNNTAPPEAVAINTGEPGQIIEQLKNTPPTQAATTYAQAQTASAQALEKQKQQVQATIPEIPAPTGLQGKQVTESGKAAQKNAEEAANVKGTSAGEIKGTTSGQAASKYNTSVPEASPAPTPAATQLAGKEAAAEGEQDATLSRSAQNALNNVQINTSQISTSAGERPNVDLSGEANPTQIDTAQVQSGQEVGAAKIRAGQAIHQDFGENNIFPEPSNETLKANKELTALTPAGAKTGKSPAIPGEAAGGLNQSLSPFLKEKIGVEQDKYKTGKDKFDLDSVKAKTDANQEITNLNEEAKQKQLAEQNQAKSQVTQHKQEWKTELDSVEKDYQEKAGKATKEQRKKIGEEKTKGEKDAAQHLEEAEKKAEAEKQKADNEAAQKKQESEKESGGFLGWVKSKAKALIDGLKQAVNFIYDNLRKAVKFIFEAAKKLALAAIDLARQAIVGLIKAFGEILKGLVQVVFAAFPEIAKKINAKIDQAVNKAVQVVNAVADGLKKAVAAVLDFLANALDTLLAAFQALYNAVLDVVGAVIEAVLGVLEKIGYLVSAATQMPDHFWGQMSEEVLGMDVTQPLAFERTKEDCANCNVAPVAEGMTPTTTKGNGDLAALLSKDEFSDNDIAVDGVAPFDIEPELLASLNLGDGGEVEFGESNNPANSIEAIKAELAGENTSEESTETTAGEEPTTAGCCDDEQTAQAKLEQMMAQKPEGAESTQKQGEPAKQGEIPANMKTIGPLTPGQRAQYMFNQLKQGIQRWFAANWGKLLAGAIAGITGFIALNILTGGAVLAAVPPLLQILSVVMAGVAMAQIAGHIGDYATKGWAGQIGGAAKSLARAVAMGAIELVFALLFNAGAIFKALKGGIKGAAKAAVTSVKTTIKATAKSAKELGKIGIKGAKTAFKNGKLLFKGVKSGFAKGAKSLDDLAKRLKNKLRFNKFSISRLGKRIQLWGHINPKVLLASGDIQEDVKVTGGSKRGSEVIFDTGESGFVIGVKDAFDSQFVQKIKGLNQSDRQILYKELRGMDEASRFRYIANVSETAEHAKELRKNLMSAGHSAKPSEAAHHIVPSTHPRANEARELLSSFNININSANNGVFVPPKIHSPLHTNAYIDAVTEALKGAKNRGDALAALEQISKRILAGGFP